MYVPITRKAKLNRMQQLVSAAGFGSRDASALRDLADLASYFEEMTVRRVRLERSLDRLAGLSQRAAIEKRWLKIHELVSQFSTEISQAGPARAMVNAELP
jgi:hypothetical protein